MKRIISASISSTEILIKWFVFGMLSIIILMVSVALFSFDNEGEAEIGSFEAQDFNEGWTLEMNGKTETIPLPASVDAQEGDLLTIRNILPSDLTKSSCIMARTSLSDIYIYVGGELREQYTSEGLSIQPKYPPSVYVVTQLSEKDAGKEIVIQVGVKAKGKLNEIQIGNGNNVWFDVFKNNLAVNSVALIVLVLGVILITASAILRHNISNSNPSFFLGLIMMDIAIWVFSESNIRQIIFNKPSLVGYFTYMSLELFGVLTCLFFDEVQHKKYHKYYVIMEVIVCIQLTINMFLHITGISEFHDTLIYTHLWMVVEFVCTFVCVIMDIRSKEVRKYSATATGVVIFLVCSMFELVFYYVSEIKVFGTFVCIGLVTLTVATVIQSLIDLVISSRERENKQTKMVVGTIETIAGAIDAKDEYTGGHSERVGHYATILARGMAGDYDFSEEDILRIQYIGNMHDIGKIGVADPILNKEGRLTDDEYALMKKHVDIGAELMLGIGENIEGLVDGIHYHHERFDGKGYPKGLSETEIPLVARIICLADCYDAMTSNRVYRKRLSNEDVRAEFVRCSGTQFDPALTEIFIRLMDSGELVPYTVNGMATTQTGEIMKSSLLENCLQKISADNPTHIRMLCYIMKLKEKKGERVDAFLLKLKENRRENMDTVKQCIKPLIKAEDISIEFNENYIIVAMFNKNIEEIESFTRTVENCSVEIEIERI